MLLFTALFTYIKAHLQIQQVLYNRNYKYIGIGPQSKILLST